MQELKDYSGPFIRDIKFEDLSKEVLGKLLYVYSKEFLVMDAYWQKQVSKRVSEDASRECIIQNWSRIGKYEMEWTMEALNVKENDIEAYAKVNQFLPSFVQGIFDYDWEVMEEAVIKAYIADFNPDIKSRALKVGFKGEPAEIACQWEFKIE